MMKLAIGIICLLFAYLLEGQSIEQVKFTGRAELMLELTHRYKSNYLTISHHQFRMAFTELHPYQSDLDEIVTEKHSFHGHTWMIDILPDYGDDQGLVTPIGFDYYGGLYYSKVLSNDQGGHTSMINYLSAENELYADIIPGLVNHSGLQSGALSKNERYMILSTQGAYTHGKEDLYVIEYLGSSWGHMTNLGSIVNTKDQEITPYLATDNKTLFFSSDRTGGKGGYDIYMTERLDDTWQNWTRPINVSEVNSIQSETSFCFVETDPFAYFIRSDKLDVYGDIMEIPIEQSIVEDSSFTEIVDVIEKAYFKVVDGVTERAIASELVIVEDYDQRQNESGIFEAEELVGKTLIFKSSGYFSSKLKVGESVPKGENIIFLQPLTTGSSITLENVLFKRATANILTSSYEQLDLLVEVMNENPDLNIRLKGHTDNKGNPVSNLELSQNRVDAVADYLRNKGINRRRISGIGYGGKYPIASNETEETRQLNRRVEFEIME
ncbi:OmpA family protein [Ekhidna sp.]|uniref:OmpA family protein n=1 Tax=Ekhidna sp. TaxID=2608089 RepID=UPI003BAA4B23